MAEMTYSWIGKNVERKMLILYLNMESGREGPERWKPVGIGTPDSSMEYDWGEESKTDIFGNTYTTLKTPVVSQSFDPWPLGIEDDAQKLIWANAIAEQDVSAVANYDLLVVHTYVTNDDGNAFAERYKKSMVKPSRLGGSSVVDMALDVTFGGERYIGNAVIEGETITFNEA